MYWDAFNTFKALRKPCFHWADTNEELLGLTHRQNPDSAHGPDTQLDRETLKFRGSCILRNITPYTYYILQNLLILII